MMLHRRQVFTPLTPIRLAVVCLSIVFGGCTRATGSILDPGGPIADAQQWHLIEVTALTMLAVLPVLLLVPWLIWRFRYRRNTDNYAPDWDESRRLDLLMWGVPLLITVCLSVLLWRSTSHLDPYKPLSPPGEATRVQVVGLDWKWLFIYPDEGIATVGELAFPSGRPLALELTADTVMQSFMISALGGQIYVMPGMRTRLHLRADRPGTFSGENMQYNGAGFHTQKFRAKAMSQDDFTSWVQAVRQHGIPLDNAGYTQLARRTTLSEARKDITGTNMPADLIYYRAVDSNLFASIIERYRSGESVNPEAQPGSPLYTGNTTMESYRD